jgi:2-polyprenyl-3-methyl-5-hydroxy-6-metoxy-1,4-benzoquinol methylase
MTIQEINIKHYNEAYQKSNIIFRIIHPFISFDQQSKTKRNVVAIKGILKKNKKYIKDIRFLDYGCGLGSLLFRMRKAFSLYGVEISNEAIRNINSLNIFLKNKISIIETTRFGEIFTANEIDIIVCSHVLEHVEDDFSLLQKFYDYLEDKGFLLLNLPINEVWEDTKHFRKYSVTYIKSILEKIGFEIINFVESDRLTSFILQVKLNSSNYFLKIFIKIISILLALLPVFILEKMEYFLPKKYLNQQLIITAQKAQQ